MEIPNSVSGFSAEAREALADDPAFSVGVEAADDIRRRVADDEGKTTETGRKAKAAKEAEKVKTAIATVSPLLALANESAAERWPELRYSDMELEVLSTLTGAVLAKHMPVDAGEWEEEFELALFVAGTGVQKGKRLYNRLKAERAEDERREPKREREDDER